MDKLDIVMKFGIVVAQTFVVFVAASVAVAVLLMFVVVVVVAMGNYNS